VYAAKRFMSRSKFQPLNVSLSFHLSSTYLPLPPIFHLSAASTYLPPICRFHLSTSVFKHLPLHKLSNTSTSHLHNSVQLCLPLRQPKPRRPPRCTSSARLPFSAVLWRLREPKPRRVCDAHHQPGPQLFLASIFR
jgi:hypothetical protein